MRWLPQRQRELAVLTLGLLGTLAGCVGALPGGAGEAVRFPPPPVATGDYPADFALMLTVHPATSPSADSGPVRAKRDDPTRRPAQHIVGPDRILRVALGPGTHEGLYPPATAHLSFSQMAELYQLAREALIAATLREGGESPAPAPEIAPAPKAMTLQLTVGGRVYEQTLSRTQNPAAAALQDHLIELRGGR